MNRTEKTSVHSIFFVACRRLKSCSVGSQCREDRLSIFPPRSTPCRSVSAKSSFLILFRITGMVENKWALHFLTSIYKFQPKFVVGWFSL